MVFAMVLYMSVGHHISHRCGCALPVFPATHSAMVSSEFSWETPSGDMKCVTLGLQTAVGPCPLPLGRGRKPPPAPSYKTHCMPTVHEAAGSDDFKCLCSSKYLGEGMAAALTGLMLGILLLLCSNIFISEETLQQLLSFDHSSFFTCVPLLGSKTSSEIEMRLLTAAQLCPCLDHGPCRWHGKESWHASKCSKLLASAGLRTGNTQSDHLPTQHRAQSRMPSTLSKLQES